MEFFDKLKRLHNLWCVDQNTGHFIKHNREVWRDWINGNGEAVILCDFFGVPETEIARSYFLNVLARKHRAVIKSFSPPKRLHNRVLHNTYQSFNVRGHIIVKLSRKQKERKRLIRQEIMPGLKTKKDLFNLKILDIWIGIDIYESYLTRFSKPTIDFNDIRLNRLIDEGIGLVIFWQDYFKKNKIAAIVVSHDNYLEFDTICKVAYQKNIPVYLPNIRGLWSINKTHSVHSYFSDYRKMFKKLSKDEQERGIDLARQQIEKRLSGAVGVDMPYSTKSGYVPVNDTITVLRKSEKIKVLICTHCFYDNPQGYGGMIFPDFYEWLMFLGKISEKTDYDWYLKVHPDPLPGTYDIIREIISQFHQITVIPHETSHHQLVKEGISFVLTCYGSVGHEYPALGVQVINAAFNPQVAYDFNWHPKSIEEYEQYLLNLNHLKKTIDIKEIYEFYYMNYYYVPADDLFLISYRKSFHDLSGEERSGSTTYKYFLEQLTEDKHREIIHNIQKFIESGKPYYFSRGPE